MSKDTHAKSGARSSSSRGIVARVRSNLWYFLVHIALFSLAAIGLLLWLSFVGPHPDTFGLIMAISIPACLVSYIVFFLLPRSSRILTNGCIVLGSVCTSFAVLSSVDRWQMPWIKHGGALETALFILSFFFAIGATFVSNALDKRVTQSLHLWRLKRTQPLLFAAASNDQLRFLSELQAGASILQTDRIYKQNCLHWAVCKNAVEIAVIALAKCPDLIHSQNADGAMPLHLALSMQQMEIAKLLIGAGAAIDVLDGAGNLPVDLIMKKFDELKQNELFKAIGRQRLRERNISFAILSRLIETDDLKRFTELVDKFHLPVDCKDISGVNLLNYANEANATRIAAFLNLRTDLVMPR